MEWINIGLLIKDKILIQKNTMTFVKYVTRKNNVIKQDKRQI